jgi:hypothetical protein
MLRVSRRVLLTVVAVLSLAFVLALAPAAMARPLPQCSGAPVPCAPVHWLGHQTLGGSHGLTIFGLQGTFAHVRPLDVCSGSQAPC